MIVTTRVLDELADIAAREDLIPFDPWDHPPLYPEQASRAVILYCDGSVRREVDVDVIDWRKVAGFRFETDWGQSLLSWTDDDDCY